MTFKSWFLATAIALLSTGCVNATQQPETDASSAPDAATTPSVVTPSPAETTVASASPEAVKTDAPIRSGTFVSGEHPTQGTARLIMQDGGTVLELGGDFTTSTLGPDLVVALHRSNNVIGSTRPPAYPINEGDYVVLAPLREYSGAQRYAIPDNINLADYQSAVIWCRQFNATFGAATLN